MTYERVLEMYERMHEELTRESYLLGAGLKDKPEYDRILERYSALSDLRTATDLIKEKLNLHEDAPDEVREAYDRVIFTVLELYLSRRTVSLSQRMQAYEMSAKVRVDGEEIPYRMLPLMLQRERDRERRRRMYEATAPIIAELTRMKLEVYRLSLQHVRKDFGYPNLYEYHAARKMENLRRYASHMGDFLRETEKEYRELASHFFGRILGLGWGEVEAYDAPYLLSGFAYDVSLKGSDVDILKETLRRGGVSLDSLENLKIDDEVRPKKSPRAFCAPIRIPDEVIVVVKPSGAFSDVSTLFHEMGHGLHFAFTDRSLSVVDRYMGRVGTSEIFSFNLQYITDSPLWLEAFAEGWDEDFVAFRRFVYMYYRRRYAAKVLYETDLLARDDWEDVGPKMYERLLSEATGIHHHPSRYFVDMDWGFYSVDYSQAWEVEAALRKFLSEEFGRDWFFKAEAYDYLRGLWSLGVKYPPLKLAAKLWGDRRP
ncbi:MAG: hypothetical protein GXO29_00745 [Thermotogae bacterium]|nr:hypothetical protein [Thermotogota bacterium]